jgi:hypothetical protein
MVELIVGRIRRITRGRLALGLALAALAVSLTSLLTSPLSVHAVGSYLTQFLVQYPAAGSTKLNSCVLCHPGGNTANLNGYAKDFAAAGHKFPAIEAKDSDGDGVSNLLEITAGTWPGDASDKPGVASPTPIATATAKPTATATGVRPTATSRPGPTATGTRVRPTATSTAAPAPTRPVGTPPSLGGAHYRTYLPLAVRLAR